MRDAWAGAGDILPNPKGEIGEGNPGVATEKTADEGEGAKKKGRGLPKQDGGAKVSAPVRKSKG